MKKIKIKKTLIALSLIGLTNVGNAQWAVTNINDPIYYPLYFGPTGVFTQLMGQFFNSTKASIDQVATLGEVSRKQAVQLQQDTDARNRAAIGEAAIMAKVAAIYPTLQACAEISKKEQGAGGMKSMASGGAGGGSPNKAKPPEISKLLTTESAKQALLISENEKLGTCSQSFADSKVGNCSTVGNYGGTKNTASSDISQLSIKGNTNNAEKTDKDHQDVANYTLSAQGVDVANSYIANATLYNAPKALSKEKLAANPSYASLYNSIMIKLTAAQQAMTDIMSIRKAPSALPDGSFAKIYWDKNKTKYHDIFGLTAPDLPSLFDFMNFNAANDYIGVPDDTVKTQEEILKDIGKKMSLNNMIAIKQLNQQENTNILLSLLLTQAVTPADLGAVNAQYSKIMNTK